jgi:outer membrane protein OmpA-like peptidoglycan-associated protein
MYLIVPISLTFAQKNDQPHLSLAKPDRITSNNEPSCTNSVSIYYYNNLIGFAIDEKGIIKKTKDGGSTWVVVKTNSGSRIRAIYFPVANIGYAVGDSGIVLKTKNGGKSWNQVESVTRRSLHSVYFSDVNNGYVMGESGTILKTSDGGETWKHLGSNCSLTSSPEGTSFTLHNVFFNRSKYDLLSESFDELDTLAKHLKENPTMIIEIRGHTDSHGDSDDNLKLSENRAKAVKEYLISKKIEPNRIRCKGYGELKPIASNASEETRKHNRRVEFIILKR